MKVESKLIVIAAAAAGGFSAAADVLHLDYPFAGSRMLRDLLRGEGVVIGRELVRTMMHLRLSY
jgi:hypothetical protein